MGSWSWTLAEADEKSATTRKELQAVVVDGLLFRLYLEGSRVTVRTGHGALKWLLEMIEPTGRLTRCRPRLLEVDFVAVQRADLGHQSADGLSRLKSGMSDTKTLKVENPEMAIFDQG